MGETEPVMSKNSPDRQMAGSDFMIFRFDESASSSLSSVHKSLFVPHVLLFAKGIFKENI